MKLDSGISLQQEVGWDRQTLRKARFLADTQSQPFLVFCEPVLLQQLKCWRKLLPRVLPSHSLNTNSLGRVLTSLQAQGVQLEVTCRNHINSIADSSLLTQGSSVLYSASHKVASHLRLAEEAGIRDMVFSTREELAKIKKNAPNARLQLLLEGDETPNLVEIKQLLGEAAVSGLSVDGLYINLVTDTEDSGQLATLSTWLRLARNLRDWAAEAGCCHLQRLHVGELAGLASGTASLAHVLDTAFPAELGVTVTGSAGQFLVGPAVTLAVRVVAVRDRRANNTRNYYVNDGVFGAFSGCLLATPSGDNSVPAPFPLGGGGSKNRKGSCRGQVFTTVILGPSGDELDVIAEDLLLPRLDEEDWLLFPSMGGMTSPEYCVTTCVEGANSSYIVQMPVEEEEEEKAEEKCTARLSSTSLQHSGWMVDVCSSSYEVDLDDFERVLPYNSNSGVSRGEWDLKNTFLFEE